MYIYIYICIYTNKSAVGVYTGRPGPADLCNYRTVDGTARPVQIQHRLTWALVLPEGGFPILSISHGSTWPGQPVARVRRPGGLVNIYIYIYAHRYIYIKMYTQIYICMC